MSFLPSSVSAFGQPQERWMALCCAAGIAMGTAGSRRDLLASLRLDMEALRLLWEAPIKPIIYG